MTVHHPTTPPKWPLKFLRFFVKEAFLEEIEGDMYEVFQEDLEQFPLRKARRRYARGVLSLFRPGIVKNFKLSYHPNTLDMFKNFFKIAWRHVFKKKLYSNFKQPYPDTEKLNILKVGLILKLYLRFFQLIYASLFEVTAVQKIDNFG